MDEVVIKPWWKSLTVWLNLVAAVAGALVYTLTDLMAAYPNGGPMFYGLLGLAALNAIVRFFNTRQPITQAAAAKNMIGEVVRIEPIPETAKKRVVRVSNPGGVPWA